MNRCVICEEECNPSPTDDGSFTLQSGKAIHYRCLEHIWTFYNQQPATNDLHEKLESLEKEIRELESFHPRAINLLRKKKNFLVVSDTEKYYLEVYGLIRNSERASGTWTSEDEERYQKEVKMRNVSVENRKNRSKSIKND